MDDDLSKQLLKKLEEMEERVALLERNQELAASTIRRTLVRRLLMRPPMWKFEQHQPRPLELSSFPSTPVLAANAPSFAIVTPSLNHARYLDATIGSILEQAYPNLHYHVQDGASVDGSIDIL